MALINDLVDIASHFNGFCDEFYENNYGPGCHHLGVRSLSDQVVGISTIHGKFNAGQRRPIPQGLWAVLTLHEQLYRRTPLTLNGTGYQPVPHCIKHRTKNLTSFWLEVKELADELGVPTSYIEEEFILEGELIRPEKR